ncbi:uncharacterized protein LOC135959937 [Calliphora vicina]|uniref:uncharacterized protein LOC135959937 n=1 Tax=Calliphora vicina TaxID=7373 RepID=UPI00325BFA6E
MLAHVYQQPKPFEKFTYDSLVRKKSSLESEYILLDNTQYKEIWLVMDLYSQIEPPLLSPHILRKNEARNVKFITDTMQQVEADNSYYKYNLNNCHIRKTSNARKLKAIKEKLYDFTVWQQSERSLTPSDKERIENILDIDYFQAQHDKKVYIGFTPYVHNESNNCMEKLADTIFSQAIYDCSEFATVTPCFATISGGSEHIIKMNDIYGITQPNTVSIMMTDADNSWQATCLGQLANDGIHFTAPPYIGNQNLSDGNLLINMQVLDRIAGLPTGDIKFVYV